MKKAQIQGQIFIYILTLIIAGLIFMFGYNAIASFTGQIQSSKLVSFEVDMRDVFSKISTEYQSLEEHSFILPSDFTEVCFVIVDSLRTCDNNGIHCYPSEIPIGLNNYPMLNYSLMSGSNDNVFVYSGLLQKSFDIGKLKILNRSNESVNFECIKLFNGKLDLKIRGYGDLAEIQDNSIIT